jgi:hypothetical protein
MIWDHTVVTLEDSARTGIGDFKTLASFSRGAWLFKAPVASVPDSGSTLMLLLGGLGIMAIGQRKAWTPSR